MTTTKNFKCVLIGDGGVGKTTFIDRHVSGDFQKRYVPTLGVEVHPLEFNTTNGPILFNVWDCAGQQKFMGLKEGYWLQADCAIVMFDLTSRRSMESSLEWYRDFARTCPNVPIVVVGNKYDIKDKKITLPNDTTFLNIPNSKYFNVSTRSWFNLSSPFVYLAQKLKKNENLRFIESVAPPEVLPSKAR